MVMTRFRRVLNRHVSFSFVTVFVLCGAVLAQGQTAATTADGVTTINLQSKLVQTVLPYGVVLPREYDSPAAWTKRYPVLYLLHGLTGHYSDWTKKTRLAEYAAQYNVIIVTPEGNDGWYTDSATSPTDKYETYILEELIPDVQRRYRTLETRHGRAIAGLSMGGYGALKFAVKHPKQFVFAASLSGVMGAASWTQEELKGADFVWRSLAPVYGAKDNPTRDANDLFKLFNQISPERVSALPYIYFDCGTEDPLVQSNRKLEEILLEKKIPHEFRLMPGNHSWTYWDRQIVEVLRVAATKMAIN
jgi:putative tributyrin esterase